MRLHHHFFGLLCLILLGGCAHQIQLTPDSSKLSAKVSGREKIKANVGYVIPNALLDQEITTPGGGGDKVRYFPYQDAQAGIDNMLSGVFESVTKLTTAGDNAAIAANKISLVITPVLSTNSSSPSPFTWPPTQFSVEMTCQINDTNGKLIDTKKVVGEGHAEFDEFKSNHGLAGQRATEDALLKMQARLLELGQSRSATAQSSAPSIVLNAMPNTERKASVARDLEQLKSMFDRGILSPSEYEKKRKELVERL